MSQVKNHGFSERQTDYLAAKINIRHEQYTWQRRGNF